MDGEYLAYVPFMALIEESKMTPYHNKLYFGGKFKTYIFEVLLC